MQMVQHPAIGFAEHFIHRRLKEIVRDQTADAGSVTGNSAEATGCRIGGIVGSCFSTVLTKCYNVGTCTAHAESSSTKIGCIVGNCNFPTDSIGNYFLGTGLRRIYHRANADHCYDDTCYGRVVKIE